jgi:CheY-like chemotaxis protein
MNLCTNAFHAMRTKGGTLTVNLETIKVDAVDNDQYAALPTGHYAKLTVSDTGHGMTQDVMQRIFEPYYTTKAKGEGTGLGLATVHGIVKSYGGSLTVKSEPGAGTVFNLFFPVIEYTETTEMTALPVKGGNERILIVDDEEQIINAMVPMLKRLGYHVTAQTSSSEALKILKQNPQAFDVLITDMTMPEMTGKELSVEAKRIRSDIPIILCTGFSDTMDADVAKTFGIDAFLIKPVVRGKMAETIRDVIKKKMQ